MTTLPDNIIAWRDYKRFGFVLHLTADGLLVMEWTNGHKPRLEQLDCHVADTEEYIQKRRLVKVAADHPVKCP